MMPFWKFWGIPLGPYSKLKFSFYSISSWYELKFVQHQLKDHVTFKRLLGTRWILSHLKPSWQLSKEWTLKTLEPSTSCKSSLHQTTWNTASQSRGCTDSISLYVGEVLDGMWALCPLVRNPSITILVDWLDPTHHLQITSSVISWGRFWPNTSCKSNQRIATCATGSRSRVCNIGISMQDGEFHYGSWDSAP